MASNPPSDCCAQGVKFEGTPSGSFIDIGEYNTYVSGDRSSPKVLLFLTDVLGHRFLNSQLVADAYARAGYYVVAPDLFNGDPKQLNQDAPGGWEAWLGRHTPEAVTPIVHAALAYIKRELKPKFIASIGYCFGARYVIRLLGEGSIDVGAAAHPSFVQIEEVAQIKRPLAIFAAETDTIYPPELRAETEAKLAEIKATYHTTLSSGVSHGFTVRADPKDKWAVAQANRAFEDSLWWFKQFEPSSQTRKL